MHISPLRKNIPLTVVTLAALGIMFFLFFMHPAPPEESLEFYAPDGNIAGSFRVEITNAPSNPAYTEVKIIPEDMESFQRFLAQFRNKPVTAKVPYGPEMASNLNEPYVQGPAAATSLFRAGTCNTTESCA